MFLSILKSQDLTLVSILLMESKMYSEYFTAAWMVGRQQLKLIFFSAVLCEIKYVLSLLSYVPHTPSRLTCLTGLHTLRVFTFYASSCLFALRALLMYLLYASCALYQRALRALFVRFKIF